MKKHFSLSAIAAALLASPVTSADTLAEVERITVTGDLRQHELYDVPYTVSVVDAKTIDSRAAQHIEDVLNAVPNLNFTSGASRSRYFQIRGIGERSQFVDPINPSVGVMIDGIDYSGIGAAAVLFDVDQVEVFRGPHGTRFGANALAGMVNVKTAAAGDDSGLARVSLSNYGGRELGVATGGEFNQDVSYRFSAVKQESDGFVENTHLNRNDTNNLDELSVRGKLSVNLNENESLEWVFHYFDSDNGYDAFSLDNNRTTLSDKPGQDTQETKAVALNYAYTGMESADLHITASFADTDVVYGYDEDWSYEGIRPGWEYASVDTYFRDRKQTTLDMRLLSKMPVFGGTTDWVAGIYYQDKEEKLNRDYTYASPFNSTYEPTSLAAYGELRTQINDDFAISAGARIERYDADYSDSNNIAESNEETLWGANLSMEYRLDKDAMLYATVSRGYKPGGANGEALAEIEAENLPPSVTQLLRNNSFFKEESLMNYEIGVKGDAFDGALTYSLQAFYMDRQDVQVKFSYSDQPSADNDLTQPVFVGYLANADVGSNKGIELQTQYLATDALRLFANMGVLRTDRSGLSTIDAEQDESRNQAQSPEFQYNVGAEYKLGDLWTARVEFEGKDDYYLSDSHDTQADSLNLVNASLTKQVANWTIKIWARNLTDKDYPVRGFFFGNDPRDEYAPKPYFQLGEPRRVGITLDYTF